MKKFVFLLSLCFMFLLPYPGGTQETVTIYGVEITTEDHVDAEHPDGWFAFDEGPNISPPPGFTWLEPNDLTHIIVRDREKCLAGRSPNNGLNLNLIGNWSIAREQHLKTHPEDKGTPLQQVGTIAYYLVKARNQFYVYKVATGYRGMTFTFEHYYKDHLSRKYRIRWVKEGKHGPKYNLPGRLEDFTYPPDENLQKYMGWIPEDETEPLPEIKPGTNTIIFPANYDNYKISDLLRTYPKIKLVYDDQYSICLGWYKTFPILYENQLKAGIPYTIIMTE